MIEQIKSNPFGISMLACVLFAFIVLSINEKKNADIARASLENDFNIAYEKCQKNLPEHTCYVIYKQDISFPEILVLENCVEEDGTVIDCYRKIK